MSEGRAKGKRNAKRGSLLGKAHQSILDGRSRCEPATRHHRLTAGWSETQVVGSGTGYSTGTAPFFVLPAEEDGM
jgi:hypothetical protein